MFEEGNEEILKYFLGFMSAKKDIIELLDIKQVNGFPRSKPIDNIINFINDDSSITLTRNDITEFARSKFLPHLYSFDQQKDIITSGMLAGHSWHQAAPSRLHLTFQRWVRAFLSNEISFDEYMTRIDAVAKQEIYMLVGANLTENLIVNSDETIIPNLRSMGISDVIINDLAYDIKNTHHPRTCPVDLFEKPIEGQEWLFDSGDLQRDLKTAAKGPAHLAYNRIYVVIDPVDKWETEFDQICDFIKNTVKGIVKGKIKPHIFTRNKHSRKIFVHTHLIMP